MSQLLARTLAAGALAGSTFLGTGSAQAANCYGASGVGVVCYGTRTATVACVYTGGSTCTPVTVTGPICLYGGGSTWVFTTPYC